jgi:hypothetical protein
VAVERDVVRRELDGRDGLVGYFRHELSQGSMQDPRRR